MHLGKDAINAFDTERYACDGEMLILTIKGDCASVRVHMTTELAREFLLPALEKGLFEDGEGYKEQIRKLEQEKAFLEGRVEELGAKLIKVSPKAAEEAYV